MVQNAGLLGGAVVKNTPSDVGDVRDAGSIPGSRRCPGEGNGNPLQHSCLDNPMDRGAWHLFKNFPEFVVVHTVKGFGIVNKAEVDVFLELSCFFHDPVDVGNLISGSSAFSKTSLNIRKFTVHILLKPGLENFEHYFTSV